MTVADAGRGRNDELAAGTEALPLSAPDLGSLANRLQRLVGRALELDGAFDGGVTHPAVGTLDRRRGLRGLLQEQELEEFFHRLQKRLHVG